MSTTLLVTGALVLAWLAIGVALSVVMGRRGHFSLGWGILGAVLGPLAIIAAVGTTGQETEEHPAHLVPSTPHGGPVDVLVGIDGSAECRSAVGQAVALLGPRLGRLTLATVVPFEGVPAHTRQAVAELERHARMSGAPAAGQELLRGQPARALTDFAVRNGYGLLVVGTRGRGLSKAVLGSTAGALAASCPVPVLMVSAAGQARTVAA
jgi:nucleotide-binding universal stress UspA family protein